jgi:hypothetical protein
MPVRCAEVRTLGRADTAHVSVLRHYPLAHPAANAPRDCLCPKARCPELLALSAYCMPLQRRSPLSWPLAQVLTQHSHSLTSHGCCL